MLAPLVSEIEGRMSDWRDQMEGGDETYAQAAAEAGEFRGRLSVLAQHELSWRIRDEAVTERIQRLREVLLLCTANNQTNSSEVSLVVYTAIDLNDFIKRALGGHRNLDFIKRALGFDRRGRGTR
jgi:hypothetical protein